MNRLCTPCVNYGKSCAGMSEHFVGCVYHDRLIDVRPEIKNRIRETCTEGLVMWRDGNQKFISKSRLLPSGTAFVKVEADYITEELNRRRVTP